MGLTRTELMRRAVALSIPMAFGSLSLAPLAGAAIPQPSILLNAAELAQIRRNIFELKLGYARRAWSNVLSDANEYLGYEPEPTRSNADVSDWREVIYLPGLHDGNAARTLAMAYAVGRREEHGARAKNICLAWARTYNPPPPLSKIGHMVAEPVGPVIKLCMAYDLAKTSFSSAERAEFTSWARQFVQRGRASADYARDNPWVDDVTYGGDRSNAAPYGNSATWQRAMAVWAAAVTGGSILRETLEWNFQHTTGKGLDYGWDNLLEGLILDGTGGQVLEDRYRSSIHYGNYSWIPAALIADVALHSGFRVDLFRYRTKRHGYTIFTPVSYYAPLVTRDSVPASFESTPNGGSSWPTTAARLRTQYEVLYRNATDPAVVKTLKAIVSYGGPSRRGDNFDTYVYGYGALFGRGPKGPTSKSPK